MRRRIVALTLPDVTPAVVNTSEPEARWVAPTELLVDEAYQRNLSEGSVRLIRRIVARWDWRRFKPPIVVETEDGLEVIDGQHTAVAAASNPEVSRIMVVVVAAAASAERAAAFIGHNRDKLAISTLQMHKAAVAAGDEEATAIAKVCTLAGVRILSLPPTHGQYKPRDTVALHAIATLVRQRQPLRARDILHVLAEADLAPVSADAIKAATHLMTGEEYRETFKAEDLTVTIRRLAGEAVRTAKVFAATHKVPVWRGLAITWYRDVRKIRMSTAATAASAPPPAPTPTAHAAPMPRVATAALAAERRVIVRRSAGSVSLGEPAPGRSALDQRRGS